MKDEQTEQRGTWTTRINLRPWSQDQIRLIAKRDCISVATLIGIAVENYVTARSTA